MAETVTIQDVQDIYSGNLASAMDAIKDVLARKAIARIEAAKPEVAASLFGQQIAEPEEEEDNDGEDA